MAKYVEVTVTRENEKYYVHYNKKTEEVQSIKESPRSWDSDLEQRLFLFSAHFVVFITIDRDENPHNNFQVRYALKANNDEINLFYKFGGFFQVD